MKTLLLTFFFSIVSVAVFAQEYPFGFQFGQSLEEFEDALSASGKYELDDEHQGQNGIYLFYPELDKETPICVVVHFEDGKTVQMGLKVGAMHEEDIKSYPGHLTVWAVINNIKKQYPDNVHHLNHGGVVYTLARSEEIDDIILMNKI
ncbi:hypothetical protein [Flammeovirga kamogawensis]|uniref:Uncharacterized protein n=1 Tax=Flammeovirga kamogawensis TaxID=373891 RepID=A0ABX8GUV0_9BACT|nr:hypothetical protein [Flammeovirga kamogawensis]MBB6459585.1 hypothetical protein [Flammeovirga kamogawensis]QWG07351.1 hypothetical protein KM029_18910 [Flammeovirga kamogawensis]TRX69168.1 hypothetical protein EO216_13910 [Flammeovirga kamogawensis]